MDDSRRSWRRIPVPKIPGWGTLILMFRDAGEEARAWEVIGQVLADRSRSAYHAPARERLSALGGTAV